MGKDTRKKEGKATSLFAFPINIAEESKKKRDKQIYLYGRGVKREAYVERHEAAKSGQFLEFGKQKLRPLIRYLIFVSST
jgi:hypothetical protein